MEVEFNASRLSLARRRRGYTKKTLAGALSVSVRMITSYESGEYEPRDTTLARASEFLDFPIEFFGGEDLDEPSIEGSSFRALTRLTARVRDRAIAAGSLAMALSDWINDKFVLPVPNVPRYQGVDPETASVAVRNEWGLGELPIRNMIHLLESHGIRIFSLTEDAVEMDAFSCWRDEVPHVFLNTMKSAERSRMDAAHELGHLVLHWHGKARGRDAEHEANLFGSAFLMPEKSIRAIIPYGANLNNLIQAKRKWRVAVSNLSYRLHTVGLLSDWHHRMLFKEMNRKGYLKNEPRGINAETSQVLGKVFKALRDEGIPMSKVAHELCIYPDELNKLVFGLTLTALMGKGKSTRPSRQDDTPPDLRIVYP